MEAVERVNQRCEAGSVRADVRMRSGNEGSHLIQVCLQYIVFLPERRQLFCETAYFLVGKRVTRRGEVDRNALTEGAIWATTRNAHLYHRGISGSTHAVGAFRRLDT